MTDLCLTFEGMTDEGRIIIPYYELVNETGENVNFKEYISIK